MMQTVVTFGGLVFWIIVFAVFLLEVAAVEHGRRATAGVMLAAAFVLLILLTDFNFRFDSAKSWLFLIIFLAVYTVLGVAYAIFKWRQRLNVRYAEYKSREEKMRVDHLADSSYKNRTFKEYAQYQGFPPQAADRENRNQIAAWIAYWPFSLSWTVLRYPWRFFTYLADRLVTMFRRMAEKTFSDVR